MPAALQDALAAWHEFYSVTGEAAATMIGLLFVAASLGSGVFTADRPAGLRLFLSASVVQFGSVLALSLIVLAPLHRAWLQPALVFGLGGFGIAYYAIAWHGTVRTGMVAKIDWDDRFYYVMLPVIGYLCAVWSGTRLSAHPDSACLTLALATGTLLLAGIHNAWDITVWSITRRNK